MKALRPEEKWARKIVSRTLSLPVEQHDDNSSKRIHDLWIRYPHAPPAAPEVTAAADRDSIKLQKLVTPRAPLIVDAPATGSYISTLLSREETGGPTRSARFVPELERAGQRRLDVEPEDVVGRWEARAREFGIAHVSQIGIAPRAPSTSSSTSSLGVPRGSSGTRVIPSRHGSAGSFGMSDRTSWSS